MKLICIIFKCACILYIYNYIYTKLNKMMNFNNLGRIVYDESDQSQQSIENSKQTSLVFDNYYSSYATNDHINFFTEQAGINQSGPIGVGIGGQLVNAESSLFWNEQERSLEHLSLNQRAYNTIPYLGRGSCDPNVESKLMQGNSVRDKKSESNYIIHNTNEPNNYPALKLQENYVEEDRLGGLWKTGLHTRNTGESSYRNK